MAIMWNTSSDVLDTEPDVRLELGIEPFRCLRLAVQKPFSHEDREAEAKMEFPALDPFFGFDADEETGEQSMWRPR